MLDETEFGDIVGSIYEAAALPDMWPETITRLSRMAGCFGGSLFTHNEAGTNWVSCDAARPYLLRFLEEGWMNRNERLAGLLAHPRMGFVSDLDLFTEEQMAKMEVYRDFFYPIGFGWGAATSIRSPSGDAIVLSLERRLSDGPVTRRELTLLDSIRPHLARAALLASRLQLQRMEGTLRALTAIGIPAAAVTKGGRIQATNTAFETLAGQFAVRARERIALVDPGANSLLGLGLATLATDRGGEIRSIPVPEMEGRPAFILHIVPVRRQVQDLFYRAEALLVAAIADTPPGMDPGLLSGLYDLTPAEAAVASQLLAGSTVARIAALETISEDTVRTHVKRILAKTGYGSQTEFIRRLTPMAVSAGRPSA